MTIDRQYTTCRRCGGRAAAQQRIDRSFTGVWLHIHMSDWQDDPHNVEVGDIDVMITDTRGGAGHLVRGVIPAVSIEVTDAG